MSVIPLLFNNTSNIFDQSFGLDLNELIASLAITNSFLQPRKCPLTGTTSRQDSDSQITADKDKYQVCLDVQQFSPNEITVKTVGRQVVVEGKHEEKEDEHGYIQRHFVRKYLLPDDFKLEQISSSLSSDGILSIVAPRQNCESVGERTVQITHTGPVNKIVKTETSQDSDKDS